MISNSLIFIAGLVILIVSSDWLIHTSVKFSFIFRLSSLFIGLVIIAFGTSAPEAAVGIVAAIKNQKAIALGNIIGSNIANIGLVLGLCTFIFPAKVDKKIFKSEFPILIYSVILIYLLSLDLVISRLDGVILIASFLIFLFISWRRAKKHFSYTETQDFQIKRVLKGVNSKALIFSLVGISLGGVVLGANLMVKGGVYLARVFGVSSWVIAITVFAVGTSLPELAASLTASFKKVSSISIGNIIGSNIINILFVLGVVGLIRPVNLKPAALRFEFPALLIFSFLLFTVAKTKYKITRWEGLLMLSSYIVFIFLLLWNI